jgi:hypothetical protein
MRHASVRWLLTYLLRLPTLVTEGGYSETMVFTYKTTQCYNP